MKKISFFILLTVALCSTALAQVQNPASNASQMPQPQSDSSLTKTAKVVHIIARSYGDSIVLRWAPDDPGIWMAANSYGYNIYRSSSDDNDSSFYIDNEGDTIHLMRLNGNNPILPMSLDEMKHHFDSTDLYAGTAAQALYGVMTYDINKAQQSSDMDFFSLMSKQYQEQSQRQYMAYLAAEIRPDIAKALGLLWVDKNVKKGQIYEYTIECLIPHDVIEVYGSSVIVPCKPFKRKESEKMPEVRISQLDQHRVAVRWDKNQLSGYFMQRSNDGGRTWNEINDSQTPIWPMMPTEGTKEVFGDSVARWMVGEVIYFDSLDVTQSYIYRVQAFDGFGDRLEWRKSERFKLFDLIPPAEPVLLQVLPQDNTRCIIDWAVPVPDDDLKGFMVTFARNMEGPWNRVSGLLDKNTRRYIDSSAYKRGRGLYRIFAVDTADNVSFSGSLLNFIEDVFPPEPPKGVVGVTDDSTGIVYLTWNKATDDDFLAYKVYFANQRDHEFIGCTDGYIYKNEFYDTVDLTSLTNDIYYYVITVDQNHNYSATSDTIRIKLPDFLAPGVCLLEGISQTDDSVTINWKRSVSDDVKHYYIYRKFRDATRWEVIATLSPNDVSANGMIVLTDSPTPNDKPYTWSIEAIDSAGNSSGLSGQAVAQILPPSEVKVNITLSNATPSQSNNPSTTQSNNSTQNQSNNSPVTLKWNYTLDYKKDYYGVVYRSVDGGQYEAIGSFKRNDSTYSDHTAPKGSTLSYYIELQLGKGRHTNTSNTITIRN